MNNDSLNIAECIFFCFHSFAFFGDGKIEQEEIDANSYFLSEWIGEDEELLKNTIEKLWSGREENYRMLVMGIYRNPTFYCRSPQGQLK